MEEPSSSDSFISTLEEVGAVKSGHFLLSSGRHSDRYVEKFDLLRQPRATEHACGEIIMALGDRVSFDLVVGPTTGGILLAFEIARQLGLQAAYAERESDGSTRRAFKRGTEIAPGTNVLVVDDILTTGGSIRETLSALGELEAYVAAIAVLVDRSGSSIEFGPPLFSLARLNISTWTAEECPICREGQPLVKPGSTTSRGQ